MIRHIVLLYCDGPECDSKEPHRHDCETASEAWERARRDGWIRVREGHGQRLLHFCPDCVRVLKAGGA